jgi:NADPH:quinone reductase-like Zn-dependent oxidoreductase
MAKAMGCRVIATSSREEKLARLTQLGVADTINYRTSPEWEKVVAQLTHKRGVDRVIEVGGGGTLAKSLASVAASGHVALIGVLTGFGPPADSLFPLVAKNATMTGIYVGSVEQFRAMNAFLERHAIRPIIDRVFPFADAERAFEHLAAANHFGKVVIRL